MNITVMCAKKILNGWFLEMSSRSALHATAKKLKNLCPLAVLSAKEALVKQSALLPEHHHAPDVQLQVVQPVANNGKYD